jgi:hypothetical protein
MLGNHAAKGPRLSIEAVLSHFSHGQSQLIHIVDLPRPTQQTTTNKQQPTNSKQQTANSKQQTIKDKQKQQTTNDKRQTTNNEARARRKTHTCVHMNVAKRRQQETLRARHGRGSTPLKASGSDRGAMVYLYRMHNISTTVRSQRGSAPQ